MVVGHKNCTRSIVKVFPDSWQQGEMQGRHGFGLVGIYGDSHQVNPTCSIPSPPRILRKEFMQTKNRTILSSCKTCHGHTFRQITSRNQWYIYIYSNSGILEISTCQNRITDARCGQPVKNDSLLVCNYQLLSAAERLAGSEDRNDPWYISKLSVAARVFKLRCAYN